MYHFYSDTCDKFGWWGSKYLTRKFFEQLYPRYADRVVFVAAYAEADLKPACRDVVLSDQGQQSLRPLLGVV